MHLQVYPICSLHLTLINLQLYIGVHVWFALEKLLFLIINIHFVSFNQEIMSEPSAYTNVFVLLVMKYK